MGTHALLAQDEGETACTAELAAMTEERVDTLRGLR